MIRRIDRIATELPPPSEPDVAGAAAVQELMGGRFGEMSTFMNYTFQLLTRGAHESVPPRCERRAPEVVWSAEATGQQSTVQPQERGSDGRRDE